MTIRSQNPATEEVLEEFEAHDAAAIEQALDHAEKAFRVQKQTSYAERSDKMVRTADLLEENKASLARLATSEMGKTLAAAISEVEKCAWVCRFYAENAERFLADEKIESDANRSFVRHLPIGPVLAVMPWNFPYWQVFRFAAPALMAGNVGLLKHASNVPQCALAIADVFQKAEFPEGSFQTLLIGSDAVEGVLHDQRVKAATLTGSEGAGAAVASVAGGQIKKTVLELGGSDPFIVMPSADLESALDTAVTARTMNNGQSCIAAKRFIVHADIYDAFAKGFVEKFEALRVGDPMSDATDVGPLATAQIRDEVHEHVAKTVAAGADRLAGADRIDGKGYFYRPGIIANVPQETPAFSEEIFGPVAMLFKVSDLGEAIRLANATRFGLGSSIWTHDEDEIAIAANEIVAGATFVNAMVASDPRLPFGGVGASGYGRELSQVGIREFVNMKTVSVA